MSKITLTDLVNLQNETTAVNAINNNNSTIEDEFDNTLSRDGSTPNQMLASLDMNSNKILNCVSPSSLAEPVTLGYLNGVVPGLISGISTVSTYASRSLAAAATIPSTTVVVQTAGYATSGDGGGGMYHQVGSLVLGGFQSVDGHFWAPDFTAGINLRMLGAGLGSGVNDVTAMTAAVAAANASSSGLTIRLPGGTNYDFSTGQFLITGHGTRIYGDGVSSTIINFNPATPATLFTFWKSGNAVGIAFCEMEGIQVISSNSVAKIGLSIKNSTFFKLRECFFTLFGGGSIGIDYRGRNWFTYENNFINADNPFQFNLNPDRALAGDEDFDYPTGRNNQFYTTSTNAAIYTVATGLNGGNWSCENENWAGGRYGVFNVDTTAVSNSDNWVFKSIRREQETGVNPTMFIITRSGATIRNVSVEDCSAGLSALFGITGIDRASFNRCEVLQSGIVAASADATVTDLNWTRFFVGLNSTISVPGLTLIRSSGSQGTGKVPYNATFSNTAKDSIEWLGSPSSGGHRVGLWRAVADVPLFTGANEFQLLPWANFPVNYAEIRVTSLGVSGIATFVSGQVAPNGCAILTGQANFAVDAGPGHLSVYHFSDTVVGIVNHLAGDAPVTVEVLFTI